MSIFFEYVVVVLIRNQVVILPSYHELRQCDRGGLRSSRNRENT